MRVAGIEECRERTPAEHAPAQQRRSRDGRQRGVGDHRELAAPHST